MKAEKVSLEEFEEELRKGSQVIRGRRSRSVTEQDYYDIEQSKEELEKIINSCGDVDYDYRKGAWYIVLPKLNKEIGIFSSKKKAEGWAQRFLGRN